MSWRIARREVALKSAECCGGQHRGKRESRIAELAQLEQFTDEWNSNQGAIVRDVAHLMTGKNLDGNVVGIAYLTKVCLANSYGLSQSRFSVSMPNRVALTAHELGHPLA